MNKTYFSMFSAKLKLRNNKTRLSIEKIIDDIIDSVEVQEVPEVEVAESPK